MMKSDERKKRIRIQNERTTVADTLNISNVSKSESEKRKDIAA